MLATGEPKHLQEWEEISELDPFGGEWDMMSIMLARLLNTLHGIAAGMGGGEVKEEDLIDDDAFVPKRRKPKPTGKTKVLHDSLAGLESMKGFQ